MFLAFYMGGLMALMLTVMFLFSQDPNHEALPQSPRNVALTLLVMLLWPVLYPFFIIRAILERE